MTFIILVILHLQLAISTSLLFEMKGYKVEYYTLIDAYDENRDKDTYNHCNLIDFCCHIDSMRDIKFSRRPDKFNNKPNYHYHCDTSNDNIDTR